MTYLQVNMFVICNRRKNLSRMHFKFDTYLIKHCHIIVNISLYIMDVIVILK
jgi:hypothetical protein